MRFGKTESMKINRLSLYIINSVKSKRLIMGTSSSQFASDIEKSRTYISRIESEKTPDQYNSADYPIIAKALNCELSEIRPPSDWQVSDSHEKVDKIVVSLSDPAFVLKVLEGIKASPKAHVLENLDDLLKHLGLTTKNPEEIAVVKKVWEEFN